MKIKYLAIIALFMLASCTKKDATKIVAHRGFCGDMKELENTIESMNNANKIGCYATEFDVRITKDNALVVVHDDEFNGMKVSETILAELRKTELHNGEKLPLVREYLEEASNMNTNLFIELKEMDVNKEAQSAKLICAILKEKGILEKATFISFSLSACKQFVKQAPENEVLYLCSSSTPEKILTPQQVKELGISGVGYHHKIFRDNPKLIKDFQKEGLKVDVWTVNSDEDIEYFINQGVDYLTTDNALKALEY